MDLGDKFKITNDAIIMSQEDWDMIMNSTINPEVIPELKRLLTLRAFSKTNDNNIRKN